MKAIEKSLKFNKDGLFTIMQITDVHGIYKPNSDTLRLIEGALDKVKPDLVVFTGDQVKGYGLSFLTGDKEQKVKQAIANIAVPVEKRGIPFIATFGNHDPQVGIPLERQMDMYREYSQFVIPDDEFSFDSGTYSTPIMSSDGSKQAFNLYLIDSRGSGENGGYAPVDREQIEWYRSIRERLREQNGDYIPSFVFQHIPVREMYELFERVDKKTPCAVQAFRTHKGEYYKLKKDIEDAGGIFLEPPSCPDENTGEFEAVSEKGDVIGIFFGHDHQNSFIGKYNGVDLGFGPSCGFSEYGNGVERGVRVYTLNEADPRAYSSYAVTYRELFGKKVKHFFKKLFYDQIPTSLEAAIPFAAKILGCIAAIILVIVLLCKFL